MSYRLQKLLRAGLAEKKKKKSTDKARVEMDDKQRSVAVESCRRGSSCKARRLEMIKSDWE